MRINPTYSRVMDQYLPITNYNRSNRTHLKVDQRRVPSSDTLDRIADDKLYGGYNNKRNREVCTGCYVRKSVNGTCNCP